MERPGCESAQPDAISYGDATVPRINRKSSNIYLRPLHPIVSSEDSALVRVGFESFGGGISYGRIRFPVTRVATPPKMNLKGSRIS